MQYNGVGRLSVLNIPILAIILVVVVVGVVGGFIFLLNGSGDGGDTLILGPEDNGKVVTVDQNTEVLIELPENPSTGYRWQFEVSGNFAELLENMYIPPDNQIQGRGGTKQVKIKIVGDGTLSMELGRFWENKIENKFIVGFGVR